MDSVLDSVPHQMSGQGFVDLDVVACATHSPKYVKYLKFDVKKNLQKKFYFKVVGGYLILRL